MEPVPRSSSEPSEPQRPLILAVDDATDDLVLITQALTLFGYAFISATDGQTALQLAQTHQPDLVLLDILLRGMSGIEVIETSEKPTSLEVGGTGAVFA